MIILWPNSWIVHQWRCKEACEHHRRDISYSKIFCHYLMLIYWNNWRSTKHRGHRLLFWRLASVILSGWGVIGTYWRSFYGNRFSSRDTMIWWGWSNLPRAEEFDWTFCAHRQRRRKGLVVSSCAYFTTFSFNNWLSDTCQYEYVVEDASWRDYSSQVYYIFNHFSTWCSGNW